VDAATIQALSQLGIGSLAVIALLYSIYVAQRTTKWKHDADLKHEETERLRCERDSANEAAQLEIQKITATNQQILIEQARESSFAITANTKATEARTQAALEQARSIDELQKALLANVTASSNRLESAIKDQVGALKSDLKAHREGTDTQLRSIHAGVEYANTALRDQAQSLDALPERAGEVAMNLMQARVAEMREQHQQAADVASQHTHKLDAIAAKLEALPDDLKAAITEALEPVVKGLARLGDALEKRDDQYRQQIVELQGNVIDVIERVAHREALPLNERPTIGSAPAAEGSTA